MKSGADGIKWIAQPTSESERQTFPIVADGGYYVGSSRVDFHVYEDFASNPIRLLSTVTPTNAGALHSLFGGGSVLNLTAGWGEGTPYAPRGLARELSHDVAVELRTFPGRNRLQRRPTRTPLAQTSRGSTFPCLHRLPGTPGRV